MFAVDPLTAFPELVVAGTTLPLRLSFPKYPASDGWTLEPPTISGGTPPIKITSATPVADGSAFLVTFAAAEMAKLNPGRHAWAALVTKADERYQADSGSLLVAADLSTAYAGAAQSRNERVLAELNCQFDKRVASGKTSMQMDGTAVAWETLEDLQRLIGIYESRVAAERRGGPRAPILAGFTSLGYDR